MVATQAALPVSILLASPHHSISGSSWTEGQWKIDFHSCPGSGCAGFAYLDSTIGDKDAEIIDLAGTGPDSALHRSGVSALLMACCLHYLRKHLPPTATVFGEVKDLTDVEGQSRRISFWRRHGFEVVPISDHFSSMRASLGSLRPALSRRIVLDITVPQEWID